MQFCIEMKIFSYCNINLNCLVLFFDSSSFIMFNKFSQRFYFFTALKASQRDAFYSFLWIPCFWRKCNDKSYAHVHTKLQREQLKYFIVRRRFRGDCWTFVSVITGSDERNAPLAVLSQHRLAELQSPLNKRLIEMSLSKSINEDGLNVRQHDDEEEGSVKGGCGLHHQNFVLSK